MNKREVINLLSEKTGYSIKQCEIINSIFEDNFLIGKKNKEKIVLAIKDRLCITLEESDNIYNIFNDIIHTGIIDKIKHPFKDQD